MEFEPVGIGGGGGGGAVWRREGGHAHYTFASKPSKPLYSFSIVPAL